MQNFKSNPQNIEIKYITPKSEEDNRRTENMINPIEFKKNMSSEKKKG